MSQQGQGYWGLPVEDGTLEQIVKRGEILSKEHKTGQELLYLDSNTPWILLRSGVDITKGEPSELGNKLAEKYILTGGTLSTDNSGSFNSKVGINYGPGRLDKAAYNPTGNSESKRYNLGIRPMPGITSVKVVPKDTWGFIYEAEVSFSVWSVEDLEAVNKLYFRPGFVALLEWGHSVYVDNSGNIRFAGSNIKDVVSPITNEEWFGLVKIPYRYQKKTLNYFEDQIKEQRNRSYGNYDGVCGYIVNYSYNLEKNGEWKCTVKIISRGAKTINTTIDNTKGTEGEDIEPTGHTIFHRICRNLLRKSDVTAHRMMDAQKKGVEGVNYVDRFPEFLTSRPSFNMPYKFFYIDWEAKTNKMEPSRSRARSFGSTYSYHSLFPEDNTFKDNDFIVYFFNRPDGNRHYIRLFDILNILQEDRDNFSLDMTTDQQGFDLKTGYQYAGFGKVKDLIEKGFTQDLCYSINPFEVMLPVNSVLLPTLTDKEQYIKFFPERDTIQYSLVIGNTYINIESVVKIIDQLSQENGNKCSAGAFITNLLSMIQDDLGNIPDLGWWEDPKCSGVIAIVDRNHISIGEEIKEIPVTGLRSSVESLEISSDITDNLANEMSVAAQAPAGNSVPANLIYWNEGVESRFVEGENKKPNFNAPDVLQRSYKDYLTQQEAEEKDREFSTLYKKFWSYDADPDLEQKFIGQKGYVSTVYAQYFKDYIKGVIPVKLSLTMKGISKFYIGTCFKIEPGLLPRDYDDWGYIVTGLEHNITKAGWKTTIKTQYCPPDKAATYGPK